jgi:murein DD-endopeptidase MepM/ murein hydrolase activator NlpD
MARVETTFEGIRGALDALGSGVTAIPSIVPVKDFSIRQSGASVGKKINPFYKTVAMHDGMDLLAASGTPVLAGADGTVVKAVRNGKREGSSVTIDHGNGYVTVYNHLGKIRVRKGQRVKQGEEIAEVGLTGMSFAPHLHYEVWYKGEVMDPWITSFRQLPHRCTAIWLWLQQTQASHWIRKYFGYAIQG